MDRLNKIGFLIGLLAVLATAAVANAQTQVPSPPPPSYKLAWDPPAGLTNLTYTVTNFSVRDGGVVVPTGELSPTSIWDPMLNSYVIAFPALTPGLHQLTVRGANAAGQSPDSNVLSVNMVVVPLSPTNLRIIVASLDGTLLGVWESRRGVWRQTYKV